MSYIFENWTVTVRWRTRIKKNSGLGLKVLNSNFARCLCCYVWGLAFAWDHKKQVWVYKTRLTSPYFLLLPSQESEWPYIWCKWYWVCHCLNDFSIRLWNSSYSVVFFVFHFIWANISWWQKLGYLEKPPPLPHSIAKSSVRNGQLVFFNQGHQILHYIILQQKLLFFLLKQDNVKKKIWFKHCK